jgi:cyclase
MRSRLPLRLALAGLLVLSVAHPCDVLPQGSVGDAGGPSEIAPGVHLLSGLSCNVLALVGARGLLVIDSGTPGETVLLADQLASFGAGEVKIAISTHFHFDHVGGNESLASAGAVIVAHERLRPRLQTEWQFPDSVGLGMPVIPPYPDAALPIITFDDSVTLHFGGQEITLLHFPNAHSDADLVVLLGGANVVHTGDLFASGGALPPLDSYHGGTIDGWIAAVEELTDIIDDRTMVVPGHGPVADRQALREFGRVLAVGRDRIAALVAQGRTLEEVLADDPMGDLVASGGWGFVRTVYAQLAWLPTSDSG